MPVLEGRRLLVMDVETTGWEPAPDHGIIEIAWVEIDDARIGRSWSSLVGPSRPISADAVRVHGIAERALADAPLPRAFAAALRAACEDHVLVFHNAAYDLPRVAALLREAGIRPLTEPVVDTLGLARGLFGPGENALGMLATRLGLPTAPVHRAMADARATAEVLLALAGRWERERGVGNLDELAAASLDALRVGSRRMPPTEQRLAAAGG